MNPTGDGSLNPGPDAPTTVRRPQAGVRTLLVLVACIAAILWAWRHTKENSDPVLVEARSIQRRAIAALGSDRPADRLTAIVDLQRLGSGDGSIAIPPLIATLEDPVAAVRLAAVDALVSLVPREAGSPSGTEAVRAATTALIRRLNDPDPAVRLAAFSALGSIGWSVVGSGSGGETARDVATALLRSLNDPEPAVRSAAATALGRIAPKRTAIQATSPVDRQALSDALAGLIGDRDAGVRLAAINALASCPREGGDPPPALAEGLKDESARNRAAVVGGLITYHQGLDPWLPVLLGLLEHDPDPSVRDRCIATMNYVFKPPAVSPAVVPLLTASLGSADKKVRSQAARLTGEFRANTDPAIPDLLRILNEPLDPTVVPVLGPDGDFDPGSATARTLGRIAPGSAKAKEVIAALTEVARSGPLSRRGWAAYALGEFGPAAEEAVPVLIQLLKDAATDDTFEREASAAYALGRNAPDTPSADRAVAALLPVLQSKVWFSRKLAIEALLRFGPKAASAIPALRTLKGDRNLEIREAAASALLAIEDEKTP